MIQETKSGAIIDGLLKVITQCVALQLKENRRSQSQLIDTCQVTSATEKPQGAD